MFRAFAILLGVVAACHGNATDTDTGAVGATTTGADTAVSPPDPDADGDAYPASVDCDDADPLVHPHASENCRDGVDQDCDGLVDEDCSTDYADAVLFDPSIGSNEVEPFVGDINKDGFADVIGSATTSDEWDTADPDVLTVTWGRAEFSGKISPDRIIVGANGGDGSGRIGPAVALLNEDAGPEWLATSSATAISLWRDLPDLPSRATVDQADATLGDPEHIVGGRPISGDFDGDGRADLYVNTWQGEAIYGADALALPHPDPRSPVALLQDVGTRAATGDLDGDGLDDLIGASDGITIYYGNSLSGCATWCLPDRRIAKVNSVGLATDVVPPTDVDGDGAPDIVASAYYGGDGPFGAVLVFPGNATGLTDAFAEVSSDQEMDLWGLFMGTTGDLDGDGRSEIAVWGLRPASDTSGNGRVCLLHGADLAGMLSLDVASDCVDPAPQLRGTLYDPEAIFGDIDGDGSVDLVTNVFAPPYASYTYVFLDWGSP